MVDMSYLLVASRILALKRLFFVEKCSPGEKMSGLGGAKQYSLGGNDMFLGENWYLGVKLVVGRESPVVGGKQAG